MATAVTSSTAAPSRAALRTFVAVVGACGLAAALMSAWSLPRVPYPVEWTVFAALSMLAGRFAFKVPGINASLSVSDVFSIASVALFGPAPATVAIAVDGLLIARRRGWDGQRQLFNSASPALSLWAGAQLFYLLSSSGPLYEASVAGDRVVVPLACFSGAYFLLNSGLTAIAVALEQRTSPLALWRRHFAVVSLNYFASASAAFLIYLVVQFVSVLALAAVLPLFAVIHLAMQSWAGRLEDAQAHVATVDRLYLSTIEALSTAIEAKDGVTSNHIHRVQQYALGLARALGPMDDLTAKAIQAAALLHDTGKLAVPERILNKPGKLTPAEFETMKLHVDVGADILSAIDFPYPVVPIVRAHHENWDGTGYPNGIAGTEIPIGARILSVVDCYDALTSDRPYRPAMTHADAMAIVRGRRGTMYDPEIVDAFERICLDITPTVVRQPALQKAVMHINRANSAAAEPPAAVASAPAGPAAVVALTAVASAPASTPVPTAQPAAAQPVEGPESFLALVNLARIVSGPASPSDVASMMWTHIRHLTPGASCAFFLSEPATDSVVARFVAGEASSVLQGLSMGVGDRLTGWVAENQQPIVNSDASLDLGQSAVLAGLHYCLALPMLSNARLVGVLTLYAREPFSDEQTRTLPLVTPHLAQMFVALEARGESAAKDPQRSALRIVASR